MKSFLGINKALECLGTGLAFGPCYTGVGELSAGLGYDGQRANIRVLLRMQCPNRIEPLELCCSNSGSGQPGSGLLGLRITRSLMGHLWPHWAEARDTRQSKDERGEHPTLFNWLILLCRMGMLQIFLLDDVVPSGHDFTSRFITSLLVSPNRVSF